MAEPEMPVPERSAGVRFPPPLVFLGFLMLGLGAERWVQLGGFGMPAGLRMTAGAVVTLAGLAIEYMAFGGFRRAGTPAPPWVPSTALVASGLHAVSRNPMYLGMAIVQCGLAVLLDNVLALMLVLPAMACISAFVVAREEAYLEARFGRAYLDYKARVPRWF